MEFKGVARLSIEKNINLVHKRVFSYCLVSKDELSSGLGDYFMLQAKIVKVRPAGFARGVGPTLGWFLPKHGIYFHTIFFYKSDTF